MLTSNVDVVLNIRQLRLVILVLRAGLSVFDRHIRLQISIVQPLDLVLLVVGHVYLAIKRCLAQYSIVR